MANPDPRPRPHWSIEELRELFLLLGEALVDPSVHGGLPASTLFERVLDFLSRDALEDARVWLALWDAGTRR